MYDNYGPLSQILRSIPQQKKKLRAFISFDIENDENLKNLLNGQSKLDGSPFFFEDWSVKEPFPESTWESDARLKIKQCDLLLVVIGNQTSRSSGVLAEIKMANEENIPAFGIYVQGSGYRGVNGNTYINVPEGLGNRHFIWNWPNLTFALNNLNNYRLSLPPILPIL